MAEICASCKKEIPDENAAVCPYCGEQLSAADKDTPVTKPAEDSESDAIKEEEDTAFDIPELNTDIDKEKRPKKKRKILAIVLAAVALCLVGAIVFNLSAISAFFLRHFGSEKSYFSYVENVSLNDFCNAFTPYYDNLTARTAEGDRAFNLKTTFSIDGDTLSLLTKGLGKDIKLDWINKTVIDSTRKTEGSKTLTDTVLSIDGQKIITSGLFLDTQKSVLLLSLKELTDEVLMLDLNSIEGFDPAAFSSGGQALGDILPDSGAVTDLIKKYYTIIINNLEDVTKSSENVEIDGVSEDLTALTCKISEKTARKTALEILKAVKDDKEIKKIIENAANALKKSGMTDDELFSYSDFTEAIDEKIKEISDKEAGDKTVVTLTDYVNSADKIVGRTVKYGETGFTFITVSSGSDYAKTFIYGTEITYQEKGTKSGDKVNSKGKFLIGNNRIFTVELIDFDQKALSQGKTDGKVRITPDSDIIKSLVPKEYETLAAFLDLAVEFECKGDKESGEFTFTLLNGSKSILSVASSYSRSAGGKAAEPEGRTVDVNDPDAANAFFSGLDFDKLIANLRKTSIPKEYVDYIENLLKDFALSL